MLFLVNVDDVSGEILPHLIEGLLKRGATNVHVVQALTKKGRTEHLFFVDAPEDRIHTLGMFMVDELGTIGMRVFETQHICFEYRVSQVKLIAQAGAEPIQASVRVKEVFNGEGQLASVKAEYEDLREVLDRFQRAGLGVSFTALKTLVEQTASGRQTCVLPGIQAGYFPAMGESA
jgi:pyridinium-3,5-bisthiocarboxylic acid mononucleotide nickel chelatase